MQERGGLKCGVGIKLPLSFNDHETLFCSYSLVAGLALNSPSESGAALRILAIEALKFRIIFTLNLNITFEYFVFSRYRIRIL